MTVPAILRVGTPRITDPTRVRRFPAPCPACIGPDAGPDHIQMFLTPGDVPPGDPYAPWCDFHGYITPGELPALAEQAVWNVFRTATMASQPNAHILGIWADVVCEATDDMLGEQGTRALVAHTIAKIEELSRPEAATSKALASWPIAVAQWLSSVGFLACVQD